MFGVGLGLDWPGRTFWLGFVEDVEAEDVGLD